MFWRKVLELRNPIIIIILMMYWRYKFTQCLLITQLTTCHYYYDSHLWFVDHRNFVLGHVQGDWRWCKKMTMTEDDEDDDDEKVKIISTALDF